MNRNRPAIVDRLVGWTCDEALPFWASTGMDAARGGFHERMLLTGEPDLGAVKRIRTQARQIYVYAHASVMGWCPEGAKVAMAGFDFLMDKGHAPDGQPGFVHHLEPDGGIANPLRDTYDHMFVLLGTAWLARATGDRQVRAVLDRTLAFIDERLTDTAGTLIEGLPDSLPRRQNPNMHAFEAMLALAETVQHPEALARAGRIKALFEARFVEPGTGLLREFFNADWSACGGAEGDVVEPGHQAEWTWLLHKHARLAGEPAGELPALLLRSALSTFDESLGLLPDETNRAGEVTRRTFRTWPQTEHAKALIAMAEAAGPEAAGAEAAAAAESVLETLMQRYIAPAPAGAWHDQIGADGQVISTTLPASTFYHLFVAVAEAERVLGAGGQP